MVCINITTPSAAPDSAAAVAATYLTYPTDLFLLLYIAILFY